MRRLRPPAVWSYPMGFYVGVKRFIRSDTRRQSRFSSSRSSVVSYRQENACFLTTRLFFEQAVA